MIYKCSCGCFTDKPVLVEIRTFNREYYSWRACPDHKYGVITNRVTQCKDCPKIIVFGIKGGIVKRCDTCREVARVIYRKERNKQYSDKLKAGKISIITKNEHLRDNTRWDCWRRTQCLDEHFYADFEALPCKGCELYRKGDI